MLELIKPTDTLAEGYPKINAAIQKADQAFVVADNAVDTANNALAVANQSLANSQSTQEQLNQIVIDGDSSVEAAQARVNADNTKTYDTLKERLDSEYVELSSQLAEIPNQEYITEKVKITDFNAALTSKADKNEISTVNDRIDNLIIPLSPENSNVEVTDSHVSIARNRTFSTLPDRLEAIERTSIETEKKFGGICVNKLVNGSFEDDMHGWDSQVSAVNSITTDGIPQHGYKSAKFVVAGGNSCYLYKDISIPDNHKIYIKYSGYMVVDGGSAYGIKAWGYGGFTSALADMPLDETLDVWQNKETIVTSKNGGIRLQVGQFVGSTSASEILIDSIMLIDLTEAFGEGNEPTVTEMNEFLLKYTEGWFGGNMPLGKITKELLRKSTETEEAIRIQDISTKNKPSSIRKPVTIFDEDWSLSSADGTVEVDNNRYMTGLQSLKLTTGVGVEVKADGIVSTGLSDKKILINLYVEDISKLSEVSILFSARNVNFSNYFQIIIPDGRLRSGWNKLIMSNKQSRWVNTVESDWGNIQKMRVVAIPKPDQIAVVNFDSIYSVEDALIKPKVLVQFDDNSPSVWANAKPIMDKYGFVGTCYVITDLVGTEGYGTLEQLYNAQNAGWCIGSHSVDHSYLTSLTEEEINSQLEQSKKYLLDNGLYSGADHFASPYGDYNETVLKYIKKHYKTHRTTKWGYESIPSADRYQLSIRQISNTNTLDQFKTMVDEAIEYNGVLILLYHRVHDPADVTISVSTQMFDDMMSYLNSKRNLIDVVTTADLY